MKILLIEDEAKMRDMIRIYAQAHEIEVHEAEDGAQALDLLRRRSFDVIVLDMMMPVLDGESFMRQFRKDTPVLMLTAKTQIEDKLRGFELGADDYLTKPFDLRELVARIRSLATRVAREMQIAREDGLFSLLPELQSLRISGAMIQLTPKEFEILEFLARRPDRVYSRDELLLLIWTDDFDGDVRVVDTHIKNIREKCKKAGIACNPVRTVWGVGYRLGNCRT